MNKQKSIIVTVIVAIMLGIILYGAWRLKMAAFPILVGLLALYGFLCGAANFSRWLGKETPLLPARTQQNEEWIPDDDFRATYDQIRNEVQEGRL